MANVDDEDGNVDPLAQDDALERLEDEAEREWTDPNLTQGGSIGASLRSFVGLPVDEVEQALVDLNRQQFPSTATGQQLDKHLEDYVGFGRLSARRATGTVNITLQTSLDDSDFDPFLESGSVIFVDTNGNRYDLTEDVTLPSGGTTTVEADVRAQETGGGGNIADDQITDVEFVTTTAQTRWNNNVASFTNNDPFSGGRDRESDAAYYRRFREENAARPDSTPDGIPAALIEADIGVTDADIIENTDVTATQDDTPFDHDDKTDSVTIDGTTTLVAQRVTMPRRNFIQFVNAQLASDTDLVVDIRFETHDSSNNEPTGTLLDDRFELIDGDFDGTNLTSFTFADGEYISKDVTFWVVWERKSGSGSFEAGPISEQVTNGGFETYSTSPGAPDDWNKFGATDDFTARKETTNVDTGSNAVEIEVDNSGISEDIGIEQSLSLEPGIEYEYSVRARTDGDSGEVPTMWVYDVTNGEVVEEVTGTDGGTSYETLTATLVPEEDVVYGIRLGIRSEDVAQGDVVYFDEASIQDADNLLLTSSDGGSTWDDAGVDSLFSEVIGGVPPHDFRVLVEGGDDGDVAQTIYDHRPAGIEGDGDVSATVDTAKGADDRTQHFDRVVKVPIVVDVTVTKTDVFGGDEDTIRDIIVNYVGGKRTDGEQVGGLEVKEELVRNEIISRLLENDRVAGTEDVTKLQLNTQETVSSPDSLDSDDKSNLTPAPGEKFRIVEPANDINVTLNDA